MALPPFEAGAVNETVACALPGVADTLCGADGIVRGVAVTVAASPRPTEFTAHIANV